MIYPANYESKIGFDRIREQIGALCTTRAAVRKLAEEGFSSQPGVVAERLALCDELRTALMMESDFPGGEYVDTDSLLHKVEIAGAFLEVEEIVALRRALVAVRDLVQFFDNRSEEQYPRLKAFSAGVSGFPEIINHIDSLIDRFGKVKDSASPELYAVRRAIREREGQASKRLQQILAQAQSAGVVEADAAVSIRDGRPVIPVSAANKKKLKGFIHDESATGKTFYIEPVEVVEITNELRELEYEERREVIRILTAFTEMLRPEIGAIGASGDYLTTIDMIRAKARFALENGCVKPILSEEGELNLRGALHPLLAQALAREGGKVVPLDLQLTREKHILVISGPNAGGKSVCLKTVGLLQYMFQCGFPIPVLENSELPLFGSLFIDIGDEQSIDNDLSTYSSHLLNMKNVLAHADSRSLVLFDEFGGGTEPVIGGAIAESILERLEARGCFGVITTHYSNLKYYASGADGVLNGAMTFDVQNIRPLFRLEMGKPGSSFAVEIARKIGLPEEIIRSASEKAGSDHVNIEKQLREIARDKRYWEQKRDRIRIAERKVEELEAKYAEQLIRIKQERAQIMKQAREEAERLTAEANRQIENTIRTIRESQADKEKTRFVRRELETFRESVARPEEDKAQQDRIDREMEKLLQRQKQRAERRMRRGEEVAGEEEPQPQKPREIGVGSKVRIADQETLGEVVAMKGRRVTVAFGQILTTVEKERLVAVSNAEYKKQQRQRMPMAAVSAGVSERKLNFRQNIDVRGMRAVEALEAVQNFVDDAVMVGATELRILHGKGTGALKEEIRRYLRTVPLVASAEDEHVELGGAGITVVRLDL